MRDGQHRREGERHQQRHRTAKLTVRPNWKKKRPMIPFMNATGTNTATMREGGGQHRQPDLGGGVGRRLHGRLAHLQVAVDVLDDHDGVVDQDADRQRQRQHRHVVEGEAHHLDEGEGGDHRGGDGHRADQGGAEVVQEEQDHDDRQQRPEPEVELHVVDRVLDEGGVVGGDRQAWPRPSAPTARDLRQLLVDLWATSTVLAPDCLRTTSATADDAVHRRARARLRGAVLDVGHVAHPDAGAAHAGDQDVGDLLGRAHLALGLDRELALPLLDAAGGQLQVLGLQGAGHVLHGEAAARPGAPDRTSTWISRSRPPTRSTAPTPGDALDARP